MSSFEENYDTIIQNNKNELLGLLNQMHALGPAFQAFHKICKDNNVKPLRKKKGQYNANKRQLSAYNIFTQEVQNDKKLKDKPFQERSKLIGEMWKNVKENEKEHQKYKDLAASRVKELNAEVPVADLALVVEVPVEVPVVSKAVKKTKADAKVEVKAEVKVEAKPVKADAKPVKAPKAKAEPKAKKPAEKPDAKKSRKKVEKEEVDPSEVSDDDEVLMGDSENDDIYQDSDADVSD